MAGGPSDEEIARAEAHAQKAEETAKAFTPYVKNNRLNPLLLKQVLDRFAPDNDAGEDGIFDQPWLEASAFYRFTEEYVSLENRLAYKHALDAAFPVKRVLP
jgi:hypothetical protein